MASKAEIYVDKQLEILGCEVILKQGWPDRLAITPNGAVLWLEIKGPGDYLTKEQELMHTILAVLGIDVTEVRVTKEQLLAFESET